MAYYRGRRGGRRVIIGGSQRTVFGIVELISRRCVVDVKLTGRGALRAWPSLTWVYGWMHGRVHRMLGALIRGGK